MDLSNVDLNLLVALDALLTECHVTRAGERLGLSQPAMSNSLNRLRKLLGDPLLVRTSTGMAPTPRAERLRAPVRELLLMIEDALKAADQFEPHRYEATFTLAAHNSVQHLMLAGLVQQFQERAPNIKLRILPLHRDSCAKSLEAGMVDLAIGYASIEGGHFYEQELYEDRMCCVVREEHSRVVGQMELEPFLELRHVLVSNRGSVRELFDDYLEEQGMRRQIALCVPDLMLAASVVSHTEHVMMALHRVALEVADRLPLRVLDPPMSLPEFTCRQTWHERTEHDPAHVWLREEISRASEELLEDEQSR